MGIRPLLWSKPLWLPAVLRPVWDFIFHPMRLWTIGLCLPLQPSLTSFMAHPPLWCPNYAVFLSVPWITQTFSSQPQGFCMHHSPGLGCSSPRFPLNLHPPASRVVIKMSLLQRGSPLWPPTTTPVHPQSGLSDLLFLFRSCRHNLWFRTTSVLFLLSPEPAKLQAHGKPPVNIRWLCCESGLCFYNLLPSCSFW